MTDDVHPYRAEPDPAFADRLEHRLLRRLADAADHDLPDDVPLVDLADPDRRPSAVGRHRPRTARWLVAAAVLVVAGVVGVLLVRDGGEDDREVITTPGPTPRNGSIVTSGGDGWPAGAAPPVRPDDPSAHDWDGFELGSGSFLYVSYGTSDRIRVLDEDGEEKAAFDCGSQYCGSRAVFGPGVYEVTLLMFDDADGWADPDGLQVTAWDGTVRDTVGISAAFTEDANGVLEQELAALAWSPDGTRLAVGTVPTYECDPLQDPCAAQVWTFGRHGDDPQLVYTAPAEGRVDPGGWGAPEIGDLAWSPDGRRLGVVVVPARLGRPTWPGLDMLRFQADGTVRTDTLYDFDRTRPVDSTLAQSDKGASFAFAWSPDGTRIAVVGEDGVEEISAQDGRVLARHRGLGVDDEGHAQDLAWLPDD